MKSVDPEEPGKRGKQLNAENVLEDHIIYSINTENLLSSDF